MQDSSPPLVSVVIPAYNGTTRYLAQAIASVLAQTETNHELIVADDASADATDQLVARFPSVRYIRRPKNGGQSAARNTGAQAARGTYLAFLDQDDLWEPTFLQDTLAQLAPVADAAVVHCDGYQVNEQNVILEYDAAMKHTDSITQRLRGGHDIATSGSLFRKTCFDAVGGYDENLAIWEDIDLGIRLYQRYRFLYHPKPLYRHRLYGHNASRGIPSLRALDGRRRFLDKHAASCKPGTPDAAVLAHDWAIYYSDLGKHHLNAHAAQQARAAFLQSLRHDPWNLKTFSRLVRSFLV